MTNFALCVIIVSGKKNPEGFWNFVNKRGEQL